MAETHAPPTETLDEALAELQESFDLLGDWEERLAYVIELGQGLAPLPDADRLSGEPC